MDLMRVEIELAIQFACNRVQRSIADAPQVPVVLDEAGDGGEVANTCSTVGFCSELILRPPG